MAKQTRPRRPKRFDSLLSDRKISIKDGTEFFDPPPHFTTVFRWADEGFKGVILQTHRVGSRVYTTPRWLAEFDAAVNASTDEDLAKDGC